MPVRGAHSFTLEVPDLAAGVGFYTAAGLELLAQDSDRAVLGCAGQPRESVVLLGGHPRKRLHHIALQADGLPEIAAAVPAAGGAVIAAPEGFAADGLWVTDPHGVVIHLIDGPSDAPLAAAEAFEMNAPGRLVRVRRSAVPKRAACPPPRPLRLGHILLFTPDTMASVRFVIEGLGMGLADQAQDVIAFTCARSESDHHVLAFAKSAGTGFHHGSFQVAGPDEVGRAGRALLAHAGRGDWGFGRHTIGSNFFHYVQDPWGSWFEYYADMDYIDDLSQWTATNYDMEDALASWGPDVPPDFVHNYEAAEAAA